MEGPKFTLLTVEQLTEIIEEATQKAIAEGLKRGRELAQAEDEYLTRKEAAELLKVTVSTLDKWRGEGLIDDYFFGRSVRFKKSELLTLNPNQPPRY